MDAKRSVWLIEIDCLAMRQFTSGPSSCISGFSGALGVPGLRIDQVSAQYDRPID